MVPPVPHELSDHVIDFLHDDCRALSACALTCRAWLAAARYHRFADTAVRGKLVRFIELLDASPGFAPYVKTLRWSGLTYQWFYSIDSDALLCVLDRLPSLGELSLTNFAIDLELVLALRNSTSFTRLNGLTLNCCSVTSDCEFVQLVHSPSWGHLGVEELRCSYQDGGLDDSTPPPLVHSLSISGLQNPFMINAADWLISGGNRTAIRELRVYITSRVEAKQVADILGKLGGSLQRLEVTIDPESNLEGNVATSPKLFATGFLELTIHLTVVLHESGLSLACLPNLRRCDLTFNLHEMFVEGTPSLPWINSMVAQLCGTCLEELVLCIQADNMEDLRALDSECGVRAVSPVRFEDLRLLDWEMVSRTFEGSALASIVVEGQGDAASLYAHTASKWPRLGGLVNCRRVKVGL